MPSSPSDRERAQKLYDDFPDGLIGVMGMEDSRGFVLWLAAALAAVREECAKIAEAHGQTLGENCWNHENSNEGKSCCWDEIAAAIRAAGKP